MNIFRVKRNAGFPVSLPYGFPVPGVAVPMCCRLICAYITHGEEVGLLVVDDTAVGRDAHFTVGEGIEGIDGLVG